jgi:hypothetical protein
MKKLLFILLLTGFALTAQIREKGTIELVPLIGYSTFYYSNDEGDSSESLESVNFGIDADYYFNNRWSIRSGLLYQTMGATVIYPISGDEKLTYLNIPVNANWHFGSTRKWNLNFGLTPSFLLSAKGDYTYDYSYYGEVDLGEIDLMDYANTFQLGLTFGIGYKIEVSKKFSILIDFQGFAGLTKINNTNAEIQDLTNSGSSFNLGGVFHL